MRVHVSLYRRTIRTIQELLPKVKPSFAVLSMILHPQNVRYDLLTDFQPNRWQLEICHRNETDKAGIRSCTTKTAPVAAEKWWDDSFFLFVKMKNLSMRYASRWPSARDDKGKSTKSTSRIFLLFMVLRLPSLPQLLPRRLLTRELTTMRLDGERRVICWRHMYFYESICICVRTLFTLRLLLYKPIQI